MAGQPLEKDVQIYLIQQLAAFEKPTVVKRLLKEHFDVEITVQGVIYYDIKNPALPAKWKKMFKKFRADFQKDIENIPIANKSFRLRELDRILELQRRRSEAQQNPVDIRATLEQAAKESGDHYTNRHELTGKDGKALIPDGPSVVVYLPDNGRSDVDPTP